MMNRRWDAQIAGIEYHNMSARTRERVKLFALQADSPKELDSWIAMLSASTGEAAPTCGVLLAADGSDLALMQVLVLLRDEWQGF